MQSLAGENAPPFSFSTQQSIMLYFGFYSKNNFFLRNLGIPPFSYCEILQKRYSRYPSPCLYLSFSVKYQNEIFLYRLKKYCYFYWNNNELLF